MACTSQSAVDFIKNAWSPLVDGLKNQKFIAEKLKDSKVFNIHNVRAVFSEKNPSDQTRNILQMVTQKGEKASYAFLKILDSERNRTLPKDGDPDLHQWISCFPLREESDLQYTGPRSCQRYQEDLKNKAQKILESHTEQINFVFGRNTVKCFSYTPVVLGTQGQRYAEPVKIKQKTKKYKKSRPKKLCAYIPKSKPQLSPDYLLKCNEQRILLVGKPGIGKTTVTLEMINLWAKMENFKPNYLFYFDETTLSGVSPLVDLESLLFGAYVEPCLNREEVLEDIKENSERVMVIVDDIKCVLRNSVLRRIIDKDLLPEAKVVVTCRLECEELFSIQTPYRVCVEGFSEESIEIYLSNMLKDKLDAVKFVMGNPELCSLCHVPVYALMVAACMLFPRTVTPHFCTVSEVYLNIFRHLLKKCDNGLTLRQLDKFIQSNTEKILDLSKDAFFAISQRSIVLQGCEDTNIEHNFLNLLTIRDGPTSVTTYCTFLHNTMQEFFAALWLLANPGEIDGFFKQCITDEGKHMRPVIPFLCGLLSERNQSLVSCLFPEECIAVASVGLIEKVLSLHVQTDQDLVDSTEGLLFCCQCLFELQSPQACLVFLSRFNYDLDLADSHLHPHQCCTLSYIIKQATSMQVVLNLENCKVSKQGLKTILDCCEHVRINSSLLRQMWTALLSCEDSELIPDLLKLWGAEMHLPIWNPSVLESAAELIRHNPHKINLVLHCDQSVQPLSNDLCSVIVSVLPHIISLSFTENDLNEYPEQVYQFLLRFCVAVAVSDSATGGSFSELMCSVCTFPFEEIDKHAHYDSGSHHEFLLDLCCRVKDMEIKMGRSLLPALQPFYQSGPEVWFIDPSKRKASIFPDVLKLQNRKIAVELSGWSDEEGEVRSFLQCLPYISQLRLTPAQLEGVSFEERVKSFPLKLCRLAALYERESALPTVRTLLTLFSVDNESDFLLDLYYYVRACGSHESLLPALQPIYQSLPAVWSIDLSKRKASLILEVLKLQTLKKPIELRGWSDEESEVRSFLQCLPYMSQLRFTPPQLEGVSSEERVKSFHLELCRLAALYERESALPTVRTLLTLFSVDNESDFLLDLYYYVRACGSHIESLLLALQPVYQSLPAVWSIDLSKRKASLLLEVLKLQTQKKPVELTGWSDEESEVRSFLQCLPYISQLRLTPPQFEGVSSEERVKSFPLELCRLAALYERESVIPTVRTLLTLFSDNESDFLLDLYYYVRACGSHIESLLPALQPVYQSAPAIWSIDLSKRKASHLLEVLKLQNQKKPVVLRGWSDEESEVRSFLQCLPYISQLRLTPPQLEGVSSEDRVKSFPLELCRLAALCDRESALPTVRALLTLFSVDNESDFLLDLYYYVKYCGSYIESLLPALQPVYQSLPAVWSIDLSKRKASLLLEVLKLQTHKKPVELRGWSDEESEVTSFLQCLPYISQLRFWKSYVLKSPTEVFQFLVNLSAAAAECDAATGERFSELLSSLCSYSTFPVREFFSFNDIRHSDFLLDLYSHIKTCETEMHRGVSSLLQSVLQSAPAVWSIDLSKRKASLLQNVVKLQTQKRPVELRGWLDEESEVRSFLQCLPYISQLRFQHECVTDNPRGVYQFLLDLSVAAVVSDSATGERFSELLCSVCSFPFEEMDDWSYDHHGHDYHTPFLLDLCSHVKNIEINTDKSLLSTLHPFYQSAPVVWSIDLSNVKACLLLEVLKLQTQKKPVELMDWADEESELRSFLQCLSYISELRFNNFWIQAYAKKVYHFLLDLSVEAVVSDSATGERFSELLRSVCSFPFERMDEWLYDHHGHDSHTAFLLDLCSCVKDIEINTDKNLLSPLHTFFQSAPAVWSIDLSKKKASFFLEVLKLQTQKKPVELRGWSNEESEVRSFLQCLLYISQLRFQHECVIDNPGGMYQFLLDLSVAAVVSDSATGERFSEILCSVCSFPFEEMDDWSYDCHGHDSHMGFLLDLSSRVKDTEINTDKSLLPALKPFFQSAPAVWSIDPSKRKASLLLEVLKLQTQKKPVELRGWSDEESEMRTFLQCLPYISQLKLNATTVMRLARAMRTRRGLVPVTVEELSLDLNSARVSQRALSRVLSCLALLLRVWTVQCLDLTPCRVKCHSLIVLLCHQGPLKLRLSEKNTQQLFMLVSESQETEIIQSFLDKIGGDLTLCTLNQEVLLHLLQHYSGQITVDFRKSKISERNAGGLLHVLERMQFKRLTPGFIMAIIREIYQTRSPQYVSSLLRSNEKYINLTTRGLDPADCAALRFTLQHSQGVRLNLMWTSIPEGELESLLQLLTNVSQLSIDRHLLLRFLHCCEFTDDQQGAAAAALLQALQHRLDFSCRSAMDLTEETQEAPLQLRPEDCRVISMVIQRIRANPELILMDSVLEEAGLEHLFSVLELIHLRCSKAQLLQLLRLVSVGSKGECVRRAVSLSHAVGGEVDLSHTVLDLKACGSLALFLEYSEGLSELDLSYCQLTDQCLEPLLPHLHKIQVLDLSYNSITDEGAQLIHSTINATTSIQTVRLFSNNIWSRQLYQGDDRFELW